MRGIEDFRVIGTYPLGYKKGIFAPEYPSPIFSAPFNNPSDPLRVITGGALTMVRATKGWYLNPLTNFITEAANNILRIEANGALIEGQRTNSLLQSREFDTSPWVNQGGTNLTQNAVGIDGVASSAWTVEDDDGAGSEYIFQYVTVPNDSNTHSYSLFVEKDNDESRFPEFRLRILTGGTEQAIYFQINTKTGASTSTNITGTATGEIEDYNDDWWRVALTVQNNSTGNLQARIDIRPAQGNTLGGADVSATGTIIIDGAQFEKDATFPSSYIPTTDSAVTRNADVLSFSSTNIINEAVGAVSLVISSASDGTTRILSLRQASGSVILSRNAGNALQVFDTTAWRDSGFTLAADATGRVAVKWDASPEIKVALDGAISSSMAFDGTMDIDNATVRIGAEQTDASPLFGNIQDLRIWDVALSDQQMKNLTR